MKTTVIVDKDGKTIGIQLEPDVVAINSGHLSQFIDALEQVFHVKLTMNQDLQIFPKK